MNTRQAASVSPQVGVFRQPFRGLYRLRPSERVSAAGIHSLLRTYWTRSTGYKRTRNSIDDVAMPNALERDCIDLVRKTKTGYREKKKKKTLRRAAPWVIFGVTLMWLLTEWHDVTGWLIVSVRCGEISPSHRRWGCEAWIQAAGCHA